MPMRDMASAAKPAEPKRPLGACTPSSVLSTHSGEVKISALPSEAKPAGPERPPGACALSSVAEAFEAMREGSSRAR